MVGNAYSGRFQHRWMGFQHVVDLTWSNVNSAFDDQFFGAANDKKVAVLILVREIAGMQPAIGVEGLRRSLQAPCNSLASSLHREGALPQTLPAAVRLPSRSTILVSKPQGRPGDPILLAPGRQGIGENIARLAGSHRLDQQHIEFFQELSMKRWRQWG